MNREFILSEIRRMAEEADGVPPGRQRFERETGLRTHDVVGKYWARWGDAVREAGFTPNVLQGPLSEDEALAGLARMVRDLGRLPTNNEVRLRRRADRSIPTHTRFANKQTMTSRLAAYCRSRDELGDVLALCEQSSMPVAKTSEKDVSVTGEVYLIKSGRNYKIGRSVASGRRTRELQIQLPERANRIHTITTDDPIGIEKYWHERFAGKRLNGEWFRLGPEEVKAFRRRRFM